MPLWSQHLLVIAAVLACIAFITRQAIRALTGKKSALSGCGSCKSCGPVEASKAAEPKVQMITRDMLVRGRR